MIFPIGCNNKQVISQEGTIIQQQETNEKKKKEVKWNKIEQPADLNDKYTIDGENINITAEQYRSLELAQPVYINAWRINNNKIELKIINNSNRDIKHLTIGYFGYDENNNQVKLINKDSISSEGFNSLVHKFENISLKNGEEYCAILEVNNNENITNVKAVITEFITEDGQMWSSGTLIDAFSALYNNKALMNNNVIVLDKWLFDMYTEYEAEHYDYENGKYISLEQEGLNENGEYFTVQSEEELNQKLSQQDIVIESTKYVVQDEEYKTLYPDALSVIIKNNTQKDIKDVVIGYVAWDENNLPVKIKGNMDFSEPEYFTKVNANDINLASGKIAGEGMGYEIDSSMKIKIFKAIPVSYTTFEGEKWSNPYENAFREMYEGKKLVE